MSSLQALGISGFRSYSTETLQKIEFNKPLTLIWGKNGSGKTTIIESLKYITTGSLPPSGEKEPRLMGKSQVMGEVRLKFRAFNDRPVLATRRALLTINQKGAKFESIEQILKTKDQKGQMIEINHQCAEIEKQISILLGTSKPILQKIVFCHQDQSLWPFQDSTTLKNIFDQLFQTRKYTQTIDSLWEQRKQYQKKIGQIKKALPYLQRLYQQDKRKKLSSLSQLQKVNIQAEKIKDIKGKLQKMESQIKLNSEQFKTERKYQLGNERRSLEQKITNNRKIITQNQSRIHILHKNYFQQEGKELVSQQLNFDGLEALNNRLLAHLAKRQELKNQLESIKMNDFLSQKELEINTQLKNAKQFLPQCAKQRLSDDQFCKRINQKSQIMEQKKRNLGSLKFQLERFPIQSITLQISMNQQQYNIQKTEFITFQKNHSDLKTKIIKYYFSLYKDTKQSEYSPQQNIQNKLHQIQYHIKIKTEELQFYSKLPQGPTLKQKIIKLKFAGIQFYNGYLDYCKQKQKCSLCSKPVSKDELKIIQAKCDKMRDKTNRQIKQLEIQEYLIHPNKKIPHADPSDMIPKLKLELQELQNTEKKLIHLSKQHQKYLEKKEQIQLNQKLLEGIRTCNLMSQVKKGSSSMSSSPQKLPDASFQIFSESVKKYIQLEKLILKKQEIITLYDQQIQKNKEKQIKNQQIKIRRKILTDEISKLENQTKDYEIINRIAKKLASLLKTKDSLHKNKKNNQKQLRKTSIQDINNQISKLDSLIKSLQIQKEICQLRNKTEELIHENYKLQLIFVTIDSQIKQIDFQIKKIKSLTSEFTSLKIEYQTKLRQIDLKAEIAFQEYNRPVQKEYLIEKNRLSDAEQASHDIEIYCSAIQTAISTIHKQKMDEVNKIIADIWQQVYHQDDISMIEIKTEIEEDSKKRKNYHYSIVMQKAGANVARVEMKGRCSMGQKVLASIVIRLALAEVFSNSARILALDQPTTFLDRGHINKLASELCKLIEINEGGALQLIIISHDLEFIKKLQKHTSNYYEISRDRNQFSIITSKQIRQLFSER